MLEADAAWSARAAGGRGHAGRGQGAVAPGRASQEGRRRDPGGRSQSAQPRAGGRRADRGRRGRGVPGAASDRAALPAQHPGRRGAGRHGRGRQRGSPPVVAGTGGRAAGTQKGGTPGSPALGDRRGAADPGHGARGAAGRVDVPPVPGPRGPAVASADRVRHRPALAGLRGDPPAHGRLDRDHDLHRAPPQVRRRRLPPRARRPVADPHGRGAPHLHAPRRDFGGVPASVALHRGHGLLPA